MTTASNSRIAPTTQEAQSVAEGTLPFDSNKLPADVKRRREEIAAAMLLTKPAGSRRLTKDEEEACLEQACRERGYLPDATAADSKDLPTVQAGENAPIKALLAQGMRRTRQGHFTNEDGSVTILANALRKKPSNLFADASEDIQPASAPANQSAMPTSPPVGQPMSQPVNPAPPTTVPEDRHSEPQVGTVPLHDKEMARLQLAILAPGENEFTFQTFSDNKDASAQEKGRAARIIHGTLDEAWPQLVEKNTPESQVGVFVTVNQTNLKGRTAKDITRARGLFTDADDATSVSRCEEKAKVVPPTMIVDTGNGAHYYWLRSDLPIGNGAPDPLPLEKFNSLQEQLIAKLGTDKAVKDLPRVFRLSGTLHLKEPKNPRLIKLRNKLGDPVIRYAPVDLLAKLGLTMSPQPGGIQDAEDKLDSTDQAERLSEGLRDDWYSNLSPQKKDSAVHYMLSCIASHPDPIAIKMHDGGTKLVRPLETGEFGGDNETYYTLVTALARSGAPSAENYFVEFARKANNADSEEVLREKFKDCAKKPGKITVGTLIYFARLSGADLSPWQNEANAAKPPKMTFINMSGWDSTPTPEREYTVPGRVPARQVCIFYGEGGKGKSYILLHLCAASALGRDWLGAPLCARPSIFIDAEDDEVEQHIRLASICRHYGVSYTDLISAGFHMKSLVGEDAILATVSKKGILEPTPLYQQLLEAAGDLKPAITGIASLANVFAGSEIDRSHVQQFISMGTRVARTANGVLILNGHPSLAGINSDSGISGSTQWHAAVRARFYLKSINVAAGQPDTGLRELVFKKNQYGPEQDSITLRYQNGMFLPESSTSFDKAEQMETAKNVFLAVLDRLYRAKRFVSDKSGTNFAPAVFAQEDEAKDAGITKESLKAAMLKLFSENLIHNENCGKPSRPAYRLAKGPDPEFEAECDRQWAAAGMAPADPDTAMPDTAREGKPSRRKKQ